MTKDSINNLYFCESSWAKLKIIAVTLLEDNEKLVEALRMVWREGVTSGNLKECVEQTLAEHRERMKELTGE